VVWRELGAEDAELDKTGMLFCLKKGCPGFGTLPRRLWYGGRRCVLCGRGVSFVLLVSTPKSWFSEQGDNQFFLRKTGFPRITRKRISPRPQRPQRTRRKAPVYVSEPRLSLPSIFLPSHRSPPTRPTLTLSIYENHIYETITIHNQQPQHHPHHQRPAKHPRYTLRALGASTRKGTTNHKIPGLCQHYPKKIERMLLGETNGCFGLAKKRPLVWLIHDHHIF